MNQEPHFTPRKHIVREIAMQVLFLWDAHSAADVGMATQLINDGSDDELTRREAMEMAKGAWENRAVADKWVERLAPKWPPHRQPPVDRNLLRLAIYELTQNLTPQKVVMDEVIELAKVFSTADSAG